MNNDFTYKKFSSEYKEQVIRLLDNLWHFPDDEKYAYFKWKYEDNPYTETPEAYVALDGDKVVAFRGYMVQPMKVGDKIILNAQLADTVTHSEYRRRGLFKSITQFSIFEIERNPKIRVSLNSSSGGPTVGGYTQLGWKPLVSRGHLFRFTLCGVVSKLLKLTKKQISEPVYSKNSSLIITNELRADDIASIKYEYSKISHLHEAKFFRWRLKNPRNRFVYAYLYRNIKLAAYYVLADLGDGRYDIVDFNAENGEDLKTLLSFFCKKIKPLYVSLWTVGISNTLFQRKGNYGFVHIQPLLNKFDKFKKPPFLVRQFGEDAKTDFYNCASWDLYKIIADEI